VTNQRFGWGREISHLIDVAERFQMTKISEELVGLRDALSRTAYRVAFVGSFSSGKSNLINSLLGFPLLAVGAVPTTDVVTLVRSGRRDQAGRVRADSEAPVPAVIGRTVPIESSWLRSNSLEFVDTPGLDTEDGAVERFASAEAAAIASDLAILVVRSVGGFDLQEQALLQTAAAMRRQDAPLVVITMLDGVDNNARRRRQ
jgi:predicted GTPase